MPKFRVVGFEKVFYDTIVEADTEDLAIFKAGADINLANWSDAGIGDFVIESAYQLDEGD